MKRLNNIKILLAVLVLFCCAANAQTITENDLVGTWHMAKIDMEGYVIDFDAGTVTPHNPENQGSEDMEYARRMLEAPVFQETKQEKIIFKPGGVVKMTGDEHEMPNGYSFEDKNGQQVLYISLLEGSKIEAVLQDGLLRIGSTDKKHSTVLYLKKDK